MIMIGDRGWENYYTLRIVRKEKSRGIIKEMLAGSIFCSYAIRYAKYIRRRKNSFWKMGHRI